MAKSRHLLEYGLLLAVAAVVRRLPILAALWAGDRLGDLTFSVFRMRRRVTVENLQAAFPNWPVERVLETARGTYRHFGRMAVEYLRLPDLSPREIWEYVEIANPEVLQEALKDGCGAVFVAAHFGNWEYMGAALSAAGLPMWYLFQEQANPFVGALISRTRSHMNMRTIPRGVAVRRVLRALRAGDFVAFLADQDAGSDGVFVDFLGRPASFARGPAVFALKTGAPIIFSVAICQGAGRHRAVFERLEVPLKGGITEYNIRSVITAYARRMETYVRRYPDHWFWMHRRWKSQPSMAALAPARELVR